MGLRVDATADEHPFDMSVPEVLDVVVRSPGQLGSYKSLSA